MISSGRLSTEIVIGIVGLVPVDVRPSRIRIAEIEQVAIGRGAVFV